MDDGKTRVKNERKCEVSSCNLQQRLIRFDRPFELGSLKQELFASDGAARQEVDASDDQVLIKAAYLFVVVVVISFGCRVTAAEPEMQMCEPKAVQIS